MRTLDAAFADQLFDAVMKDFGSESHRTAVYPPLIRVAALVHRSSPQVLLARRYLRREFVGGRSFFCLVGGAQT